LLNPRGLFLYESLSGPLCFLLFIVTENAVSLAGSLQKELKAQ
jgi:hypothetical protein